MLPETELIVALCHSPLSDFARKHAVTLLASPIEWESFFGRAAQWQLEPVVMSNLRSMDIDAVPAAIRERAIGRERESRGVALARTLMMIELLKTFDRASIATIVLKGPALGVSAYGDPSLRT
ncbi:MAG: nucleotidyltransferase family protein, partial [Gemmatimonadaceae bacterium]